MPPTRRSWQDELAIIDRVMKAVSDITDPEEMVSVYWRGVDELMPVEDFLALSRRGVAPPHFLVTRSSRFTEHFNPWTQRDRLPRLSGGLLGEIAYADRPVIIEDLPARLSPDDPGYFYLNGFQSLIATPQYENGVGLNIGMTLYKPGVAIDHARIPMMHWQASLFGRGTQNLVLRNQLQAALGELDRELQVVGEIQRSLLPREFPDLPGFDMAADYHTSARAGGDYYDFFPLPRAECGIFIADVAGHGTPAAVLMAITHAIAHTRPGEPRPPSEILDYINRHLTRMYTASGAFITALYATLDPATRRLVYSRAGHNPPRLLRGGRVLSLDAAGALPLGIVEDEAFSDAALTLESDDLLLLYTDGITEALAPAAPGEQRELFGVERLDNLLLTCVGCHPDECIRRIREAVAEFTNGAPATDDQTLIAVRCRPT